MRPKNKTDNTEVVDLILPPIENEPVDTSNEIIFINTKICQEGAVDNNKKTRWQGTRKSGGRNHQAELTKKKKLLKESYRDYKTQAISPQGI